MYTDKPPLALIAGPTASGKSARALALAEQRGGTIINADAMQVYAGLRVVTAGPSPAEEARAPHCLFGHVDPGDAYSAARWAVAARQAIRQAWDTGRFPILVGGTGLYIRTLLDGIAPIPEIDPEIRDEVRALIAAQAHAALSSEDPAAAARLSPADTTRNARALEVVRATGRSILAWRAERTGGIAAEVALDPLIIDPPAAELAARIDARVDAMFAGGAIEEVKTLAARNLDSALPAMRAIGVPPLLVHLAGATTLAEAAAATKRDTQRYAKRQRTWLRHQFPSDWPRVAGG